MKRILVVDDNMQFLKMVTEMLSTEGFQVGAAASGKIALDLLDHDGPWDVVLCDILMPDQDGIETMQEILSRNKKQKIITMSGGGRYMYPQQILDATKAMGATEVLYKPFSRAELLKILNKVDR